MEKFDSLLTKPISFLLMLIIIYIGSSSIELPTSWPYEKIIDGKIIEGEYVFGIKMILIDNIKFNGDFLEAQAFAYLAIRCVKKLPLSIPTTTGVKKPTLGGVLYK